MTPARRRRPDRRLPLYRQRSARTDRSHLRARAALRSRHRLPSRFRSRPVLDRHRRRSAGRPTRIAMAAASPSATSPSCRRCRRREFETWRRRLADAGVAVTVLPATDLFLTGRDHDHNVPRGVTPAHRLLAHGVTCSLATNNVLNPFTPFGDCSLIRIANLYANVAQLGDAPTLAACLDMVTRGPAKLMNLAGLRHRGRQSGRPGRAGLPGGGGRGRRDRPAPVRAEARPPKFHAASSDPAPATAHRRAATAAAFDVSRPRRWASPIRDRPSPATGNNVFTSYPRIQLPIPMIRIRYIMELFYI